MCLEPNIFQVSKTYEASNVACTPFLELFGPFCSFCSFFGHFGSFWILYWFLFGPFWSFLVPNWFLFGPFLFPFWSLFGPFLVHIRSFESEQMSMTIQRLKWTEILLMTKDTIFARNRAIRHTELVKGLMHNYMIIGHTVQHNKAKNCSGFVTKKASIKYKSNTLYKYT